MLAERAHEHFVLDHDAPFMVETCHVQSPLDLPAITHVDGSARPQTVGAGVNPGFHALLRAFERRTGCPLLLNTSFNLRGEPIVCSPTGALVCSPLSRLTRQLAETLASDEGALTLARMQRLTLAAARSPAVERPDTGLRLGIWDPVAREDGAIEFARASGAARVALLGRRRPHSAKARASRRTRLKLSPCLAIGWKLTAL